MHGARVRQHMHAMLGSRFAAAVLVNRSRCADASAPMPDQSRHHASCACIMRGCGDAFLRVECGSGAERELQ